MFKRFVREEAGQTATEYMLILSVVVIATVASAYQFVPAFSSGVNALGQTVQKILATGSN